MQVSAVDIDFPVNSNITYTIVPGNMDHTDMFTIHSHTGHISLKHALNYETLTQGHVYNVVVMATVS